MRSDRKLHLLAAPKASTDLQNALSGDQAYWRQFQSPVIIKELATVNAVQYAEQAPHDLVVASSTRIQLYNSTTNEVKETITRFHQTVCSASFRRDGKLIVGGDEGGFVQIFNPRDGSVLRGFHGHTGAVHVAKFMPGNQQLLSCSDDASVRIWDITGQSQVAIFTDHTDYIRSAAVCPNNPNIVATGSYDHTIRLYDLRTNQCTQTIDHGEPVEDLIAFPSGTLFAAAGGPHVKLYDGLTGGRTLCDISNFEKSATCLALDSSHTKLIAGSLDRQVKVFNLRDYKIAHVFNYPAPVLKLSLSPDETRLAAGMTSGTLSIHRRFATTGQKIAEAENRATKAQQAIGSRGLDTGSSKPQRQRDSTTLSEALFTNQDTVMTRKSKSLRPYEVLMKQYRYADALDFVISKHIRDLNLVVSFLVEMNNRNALRTSLQGRDATTLVPLLTVLQRGLHHHAYVKYVTPIIGVIIDMYADTFGRSPQVDSAIMYLHLQVKQILRRQERTQELKAIVEMLVANNQSQ
ncbi:U3 small nucleolar RNA-associated protein [Dimargaris xerosporica]|nr:U3 small nucleolar RNA-associated protein [Dimargaris xerosporica]